MKKLIIPVFGLFLAACTIQFAPAANEDEEEVKRNTVGTPSSVSASVEADPDAFPDSGGGDGGAGPDTPPSPSMGDVDAITPETGLPDVDSFL